MDAASALSSKLNTRRYACSVPPLSCNRRHDHHLTRRYSETKLHLATVVQDELEGTANIANNVCTETLYRPCAKPSPAANPAGVHYHCGIRPRAAFKPAGCGGAVLRSSSVLQLCFNSLTCYRFPVSPYSHGNRFQSRNFLSL